MGAREVQIRVYRCPSVVFSARKILARLARFARLALTPVPPIVYCRLCAQAWFARADGPEKGSEFRVSGYRVSRLGSGNPIPGGGFDAGQEQLGTRNPEPGTQGREGDLGTRNCVRQPGSALARVSWTKRNMSRIFPLQNPCGEQKRAKTVKSQGRPTLFLRKLFFHNYLWFGYEA